MLFGHLLSQLNRLNQTFFTSFPALTEEWLFNSTHEFYRKMQNILFFQFKFTCFTLEKKSNSTIQTGALSLVLGALEVLGYLLAIYLFKLQF